MFRKITILLIVFLISSCLKEVPENDKGNVIFLHPDGTGLAAWNVLRIIDAGPDSEINWDKLKNIGLYKSHTLNSITTSSNAGAVMHAYGVKAHYHTFGKKQDSTQIIALSGKKKSIMQEAHDIGIKTGLINSGSIIEPGTAVFASSAINRGKFESITQQVIQSGTEVIMSGGEKWMLPKGTMGKFGEGQRTDSLNLIEWAKDNGYTVVYNKEELKNIDYTSVDKLLGVFAYSHTFNHYAEEELAEKNMPQYWPDAPSIAEMTEVAIKILSKDGEQFFLVVEEEGSDNFANHNNASGTFEALRRADKTIGVANDFIADNPNTLLIVASDSEAGSMGVLGPPHLKADKKLNPTERNGSPVDGINGTESLPFISKPDKNGNTFPFYIAWAMFDDSYGGVVAKAGGLNAEYCQGLVDNTDIYRMMYLTLFGKSLYSSN